MNKLTKIGLFTIFSIFLTACDQPEKANTENTLQTPAQPTQIEETQPNTTQTVEIQTTKGAEDYKTLREWQDKQEQTLNESIISTTNSLTDKEKSDPNLVQEIINKTLLTQIDNIKTSAEQLNLQDPEVKALKDKTIEVLTLGTRMIVEGAKLEQNPTPEAHKAFAELQIKLNTLAEEGQKLENNLKAKYEAIE